ncbi:MAG: META domain-containing protein [Prevotellaceae bacterium]|jgi:heat shock protein HslJ|nr:META domain-containing protein [Prevotellaceae bacterium]
MTKKILLSTGILLLALNFNACKSNKTASETKAVETTQTEPAQENKLVTGKRYILKELRGNAVTQTAYISIAPDGKSFSGNLSCNSVNGNIEQSAGNRIRFTNVVTTLKLCLNNTVEEELKQVLNTADSYYASGNKLTLVRARMAPLAVFEIEE